MMTTTGAAPKARQDALFEWPRSISVDPPWQARDANANGERGASFKYDTMSTDEICALTLPPRAEKNALFLWRIAAMQRDALRVLDAWGYLECAELVWEKLRPCQQCCATGRVDVVELGGERVLVPGSYAPCPSCLGRGGTPNLGLGHYVRNAHETCLIARPAKGSAPERLDLSVSSHFAAPMLVDIDGELPESNGRRGSLVHSAKPDAFFAIVERLYPGPYLELFSRRTRPGWTTGFSNQDAKLDEVARKMREVWPRRVREERIAKLQMKAARS